MTLLVQLSRTLFFILFMILLIFVTSVWMTFSRESFTTEPLDEKAYNNASRNVIESYQSVLHRSPTDDELTSYVSAMMLGHLHEKDVKELLRSTSEYSEQDTNECGETGVKAILHKTENDVEKLMTAIPTLLSYDVLTTPSSITSDKPIRKYLDKMNEQGWRAESEAALANKDQNECDDLVLDPSQKWTVPVHRPPVCVTSHPDRICSSTDQTSLLGTLLRDANDTAVGSIMPKFTFHSEGERQCHKRKQEKNLIVA